MCKNIASMDQTPKNSSKFERSATTILHRPIVSKRKIENSSSTDSLLKELEWLEHIILTRTSPHQDTLEQNHEISLPTLPEGNYAENYPGFYSWYILQHARGYKPFVTVMNIPIFKIHGILKK